MAIAEDEEEEEDEEYQSRSSSQDSSPPLTPMSAEMPLPPAVFASAGKSTLSYEVDDRDNAIGVAL
ncbi:hypothetical protein FRC09_016087 [Ceratobasidium sp. 395]|nr:hypothetical protein FRC09_016087 [Ceratobasidium sp. 395]